MNKHSVRIERALSPKTASSIDDPTEADSTTVFELPILNPRSTAGSPEVLPDTPERVVEKPAENEPPVSDARSSTEPPVNWWISPLRISLKSALWIVLFPFLGILPFIVVLRISVVSYKEDTLAGWESLGIGMISAVVLVCLCIAAFMWTFQIRRRHFMTLLNVCLTAMLCYCGYALFYLATNNAKTEEVRSYYTSLHPFLRVAVKNLTLVDTDLVVTDTQRTKKDYRNMGLNVREQSLHFRQPTGFIHAVDIRTNGRSKLTNLLVELYFVLMGFETIRHVGTADHLHVSLPFAKNDG